MDSRAIATVRQESLAAPVSPEKLLAAFGAFLRLNVAEGDASPHTLRNYHSQVGQFVEWCQTEDVNPAQATEDDVIEYRKHLVNAGYARSTIAYKLGVVRRLYDAATWRGIRMDNPAAGIKAPRARTAREERVKFLPLEGLKRLLAAPQGDDPQARRNRAILALMGRHGLRVAEVAGLQLGDLDLEQGTVKVLGKGRKRRTVYLTEQTTALIAAWLEVRAAVARADVDALFVVTGPRGTGTELSTRGLRAMVDVYLDQLGLKAEGVSCHALRHSAATWARAGGARLDAIGAMLGHASTTTTQVYAKIVDRISENPARYLEAMLAA